MPLRCIQNLSLTSVLGAALTVGAAAQGDNCGSATSVSGSGVFSFSTASLTPSGFSGGGPCLSASSPFHNDGFFQWTATAGGDFQVDTNASNFDTQLAIHEGVGCGATCVAYDDDDGPGTRSLLLLNNVVAGTTYLIQVGGYNGDSGQAVLRIAEVCAGPNDALEPNDSCQAPLPIAPGLYPGLFVGTAAPDFFSIVVPPGVRLDVDLTRQSFDVDTRVFDVHCNLLMSPGGDWFYSNATGSDVTLIFEVHPDPSNPVPCTDYDLGVQLTADPCASPDDDLEENDSCATPAGIANGIYVDRYVSRTDKDHYAFCLPSGGRVFCAARFTHSLGDVDLFLWDSQDLNCGTGFGSTALVTSFSGSDNEALEWTNTTGAEIDLVLEVNLHFQSVTDCNRYNLVVEGAGGCGTGSFGPQFCTSVSPNSAGFFTRLLGVLGSGAESGLHLEVTRGTPHQFAFILVGTSIQDPGTPLGTGQLCLSTQPGDFIGRYSLSGTSLNSIGRFDSIGRFQNLSGTSSTGTGYDVPLTLPISGAPMITAGQTWYFQAWHREPNGQSHLSNGLPVHF